VERDEGNQWRNDIGRLRDRLDRIERQHAEALDSLRLELSALADRAQQPAASEPAPAPLEVPEPEVVPVQPPPLPAAAPAAAVSEDENEPPSAPFELQFGRVWLVRLGIVLLLTGLVLLGNFAYKNWIRDMPNGLRLTGLFICAGVLIETGRRLAAKSSLQKFGEVILAGGLSFFYHCTFAAHQVPRLRVIDSPVPAAVLLLFSAGLIAAVSWIRNAKATAVLGLLLASYATMLQPIGWLSCVSNILLAGAGLLLMRRPGWAGPGVAAMAGSYAAFLGWQWMGAAHGDLRDPAVLWFLPSVWAMFSLPGWLGRFRETMSDRARAWFTGSNNAAFFLLFSGLWIDRFETEHCWVVCGVFGAVLIALGIIGRRASQIAGGVNLAQGLLLVSLAAVLKLEGYHLALALAGESLALAAAFAKFRGRSELVFSFLAAAGATSMLLFHASPAHSGIRVAPIPVWSAGLASFLIAAASLAMRRGMEHPEGGRERVARALSALVFFMAVAATIWGWSLRLAAPWPVAVLAGISALLAAITLRLDPRRLMPEATLGSLIFGIAALNAAFLTHSSWAVGFAAGGFFAACWLWHRAEDPGARGHQDEFDLIQSPWVASWIFSAATVTATWVAVFLSNLETTTMPPVLGIAGFILVGLAVLARCERLGPCAALLNAAALYQASNPSTGAKFEALWVALAALLTLGAAIRLPEWKRTAAAIILRATAFVALCLFWWRWLPENSGDAVALMALALTALAFVTQRPLLAEAWGFLAVSICWFVSVSTTSPWLRITAGADWRGAGVVLALLFLLAGHRHHRQPNERLAIIGLFGGIASVLSSVWATQMLVWRHDWTATAVLWTLLGFIAVSAGLWQRLKSVRQIGFALLTLALIKVFAVDVWDFNAFMRVVSFIVLGVALIMLGLFYNKFALVLRRILEDEDTV
jgi:uncharacterized membrane protein